MRGFDHSSIWKLAHLRLEHQLETHHFDEQYERRGRVQRCWARNHIRQTLAAIAKGYYEIDCATDIAAYSSKEVADRTMEFHGLR